MATMAQFQAHLDVWGGVALTDGLWAFDLELQPGEPTQRVFADHEVNKGQVEYLLVRSAIGPIAAIDLQRAFLDFGQMLTGAFSHAPVFDTAGQAQLGTLMFGSSLPLATLELTDPMPLLVYLYSVAGTARYLAGELGVG